MSDILSNILEDTDIVDGVSNNALSANDSAKAAVSANNDATNSLYSASNARAQMVTDQTAVVAATKNQGQLVAQTALQSYAHALGVDADGSLSAQQATAQQTFLDASKNAADAAATIAQKRSISFFDDPLQWLTNKITINTDIDNYNGAADQANTAEQFIQESNQLIDARAVALRNVQTVTSQAASEAATNIAVEQQQELQANLQRAGIAANTAGVEAITNMSYRQIQIANARLDSDSKYLQAIDDQKRLQLSQESHDLEAARLNLEMSKDQDKLGADQYMSGQLRKGLQLMFPNNPAAWDIPNGKYQAMISGKSPMDPVWKKAFDVAQASDQTGTSGGRILGTSPADTIGTLAFRPTIAPNAQPTVDLLTSAATQAIATPAYKQAVANKDTKATSDIINNAVEQRVISDSNHTDSPTSLYYLPPADQIVQMNPGLQDSPLYSAVIAPAVKAGIKLDTPVQVTNLAMNAINAGAITLNDAANGISNIYAQGQAQNFAAKQLFSLGIVAAPSYIAADPQLSVGAVRKLNYTNPIDVKSALMRMSGGNIFTNASFVGTP